MTSEEQVATLLRLKGAEGAVAYLLGYIEGIEIEANLFRSANDRVLRKSIAKIIKQMESDNG